MVLVDSSVWIDFFRQRATPQTEALERLIDTGDILVGDLVLAEVLQGFVKDRDYALAMGIFARLPRIAIADHRVAVLASVNFRALRSRGVTVRGTIDTLIATRCIVEGLPLLYSDRDFDPFVAHLGLAVYEGRTNVPT